jgi:hypothetical protein
MNHLLFTANEGFSSISLLMKTLLCCVLVAIILSCTKSQPEFIAPEYPDWYTLTSPIDDPIQGVWGDVDKTLLISTTYAIFRSTDQGTNWQQVDQQQTSISGIVEYKDTLFAMNGIVNKGDIQLLANVGKYSVDSGNSWRAYNKYNSFFDTKTNQQLSVNAVTGPNGISYKINQVFLDSTTTTVRRFDTPGVITSDGRKIDLPQLHQLRILYLDAKNRLYLAGTDAICSRGAADKGFLFCNSKNGRGIVYISKQPLP